MRLPCCLDWPRDAFYSLQYRNHVLWAFHRESAAELRSFIASRDRDAQKYRWRSLLVHVPSHFLGRKDRNRVLNGLDRLLQQSTTSQ